MPPRPKPKVTAPLRSPSQPPTRRRLPVPSPRPSGLPNFPPPPTYPSLPSPATSAAAQAELKASEQNSGKQAEVKSDSKQPASNPMSSAVAAVSHTPPPANRPAPQRPQSEPPANQRSQQLGGGGA